jgi:CP family cyanate transporter-like MFS transporter
MVFLGILLMALSARLAVAGVSPILSLITTDLPFDAVSIGILGMLPTLGFALMGFLTPQLIPRVRLEPLLLIAILLAVAGQSGRALGTNVEIFLLLSLLTMLGLGLGNIVLPPLVKKYFPDRVGLLTALYVTLFAISTAVAPQLAVPISERRRMAGGSWRVVTCGSCSSTALDRSAHTEPDAAAGPHWPHAQSPTGPWTSNPSMEITDWMGVGTYLRRVLQQHLRTFHLASSRYY